MTTQDRHTLPNPNPSSEPLRGRWPATAVFFLNGLTLSTYIVRMPSLKSGHHLTDGKLGITGMCFGLAALAAMQFVGPLVARTGSAPLLRISLAVMPVLLAVVGLTSGFIALTLAVTVLGAVHGSTDAAMNAHAITVERLARRPILSGCHAAWSISAVVASLIAAALAQAGVSLETHFLGASVLLLAGGLLLGPLLLPASADQHSGPARTRSSAGWRTGWTRTVVSLGLTGTILMLCEGAALGWGAIFLHESRGASLALSATAVTAYTAGQTAGRLVGDRLTLRYGAGRVFRTGGLIGVVGLALAVLSPPPGAAIAGFAVLGVGASVLLPLTFSAVGQAGGSGPGAAVFVSRFTTFTYAGILLGPALIGWTAQLAGLTWTLAALIPMLAAVAVLSRLPEAGRRPEAE
jgi:MFS family permease